MSQTRAAGTPTGTSTEPSTEARPAEEHAMTAPTPPRDPLIAEDVLLLLFDPRTGTIAGEGTLFYTLAGTVLAELALHEHVELDEHAGWNGTRVHAIAGASPADPLLHAVWDRLAQKPRQIQTFLAEIGPGLRQPVLERLLERGDIRRQTRRIRGVLSTSGLLDGGTSHRAELLEVIRPVLLTGTEPGPRAAVLVALLSASGSLPSLHHDIPWSGVVHTHAKKLERGDWVAAAAGGAVACTTKAITTSNVSVVSALTLGR